MICKQKVLMINGIYMLVSIVIVCLTRNLLPDMESGVAIAYKIIYSLALLTGTIDFLCTILLMIDLFIVPVTFHTKFLLVSMLISLSGGIGVVVNYIHGWYVLYIIFAIIFTFIIGMVLNDGYTAFRIAKIRKRIDELENFYDYAVEDEKQKLQIRNSIAKRMQNRRIKSFQKISWMKQLKLRCENVTVSKHNPHFHEPKSNSNFYGLGILFDYSEVIKYLKKLENYADDLKKANFVLDQHIRAIQLDTNDLEIKERVSNQIDLSIYKDKLPPETYKEMNERPDSNYRDMGDYLSADAKKLKKQLHYKIKRRK